MKMYRTVSYSIKIEEVEVIKETSKTVVVKSDWRPRGERRDSRVSSVHRYHDTWDDAHAYLLGRVGVERGNLQKRLADTEKEWETLAAMQKPSTPAERDP